MSKRLYAQALVVMGCAVALGGCQQLSAVTSTFSAPSVAEAQQTRRQELKPIIDGSLLKQSGVLTVGIKASATPPFSLVSDAQSVTGLDVDLASALASKMGLSVKFQRVSSVSNGLQSCDIIMDVRTGEDSGSTLVGSYAQSATGIFQKGSTSTETIAVTQIDPSTLKDKKVGVQNNSVSSRTLTNSGVGAQLMSYNNVNEAFAALEAGDVDFVACDAYAGAYLSESQKGIGLVGLIDQPQNVGIAVAASSTELQKVLSDALTSIQSNGIETLLRTWWINGLPQLTAQNVIVQVS